MAMNWAGAARRREPVMTELQARERADALHRLGFANYREYLKSDLWHSIRLRVYARDKHRCQRCRKPAAAVHHTHYGYDAMAGARIEGMQAVCKGCHKCGHQHGKIIPVDILPRRRQQQHQKPSKLCLGCGEPMRKRDRCKRCRDIDAEIRREERNEFGEVDREFAAMFR